MMKVGARNRLQAEVTQIKRGTVMGQVKLKVTVPATMESVLTLDSLDELGLKEGDKVQVIVKAIHVLLLKE
jgi:molybdate transport system regulatory protein